MPSAEEIRDVQRATWAGLSAGWEKWDSVIMDQLGPVGAAIIERLDIAEDHQHLDIASGTGEPGLSIARLSPKGRVVLTDLVAEMLDIAARRARAQGVANIETKGIRELVPFELMHYDDAVLQALGERGRRLARDRLCGRADAAQAARRGQASAVVGGQLIPRAARTQRRVSASPQSVVAASVAGAGLLGASLSTEPDSTRFYVLALGTAGTWLTGGLVSGPLHLGWAQTADGTLRRPMIEPIATGAAAFGIFYGAVRIARRIPILNEAIASVLRYSHQGSDPLVLATTLANGLGEGVFFRGGLFTAVHRQLTARTLL